MDEKTITKVWTALGIVLAYLTLNAWIITQAGNLFNIPFNIFSAKISNHRFAICYFAIGICAPLSWYVTYLAIKYKKEKNGALTDTIPVAFSLKLDNNKREAKIYQYFFFFVFQIFPLLGQIHFLNKSFHSCPVIGESKVAVPFWDLGYFWKTVSGKEMVGICETIDNQIECIAFYPFFEPLLAIFFVLLTIVLTLYYLFSKRSHSV